MTGALLLVIAVPARAAPPTPTAYSPFDGGWTSRPPLLRAQLRPAIPPGVVSFEFEVQSPLGVTTSSAVVSTAGATYLVDHTPPSPPDAGEHYWRVRAVDTQGVASGWMPLEAFRIDDAPPPLPATVSVTQDGGVVTVTCDPVVDTQSGVAGYHVLVGQLGPPGDGGPGATFSGPLLPLTSVPVRLGSGSWTVGEHPHDGVGNTLGGSPGWLPVVVPGPTLPAPDAPRVTRFDGGAWPLAPYIGSTRVFFRLSAPVCDGGFSLLSSVADSGVWGYLGETGADGRLVTTMNEGRWELRSAALSESEVSDWSPTVFIWIDATRPRTPAVDGGEDGGVVELFWSTVSDPGGPAASGVAQYRVVRTGADASVLLGVVPAGAPLTMSDEPMPGTWEYQVFAEDRAANVSGPGRLGVTLVEPVVERSLRVGCGCTSADASAGLALLALLGRRRRR